LAEELPLLVNRCLAGDQPSFGELINRFRGQVYGLCYRMLGQREDAEDATQETFVRVVRNLHRWDPERAFEPWLLTIAGNRCRTRLAKRMRRPGTMSLDYPIEDPSAENRRATLLAEEMDHVLCSVRKEYRDAFLLFHKQEMCYNEISETLGVPLGTVKTWVHRARRELVVKLRKRGALSDLSAQ
jgi:RNA polymerase sigma-70 factor (ECF subfamily)